jgi:predicted phage terminase large subunit-like protein
MRMVRRWPQADQEALLTIQSERARSSFGDWLREVSPDMTWDAPHLAHIRVMLARVTRGEIDRLMLFVPPRHGKSEMATVRYPVWRMERDPTLTVIVGAYNKALADNFSRKSRRIARERFAIDDERKAADEWQTPQGGVFRAAGVGTGVTGKGAKLVVIDDPVKSREEANSPAYRERVWNWYRDDLYTRLEPGGAIILIMTRWHEDDLAGRILASEDAASWTVVTLPAEAEVDDPLGREPGAALWPGRFDVDDLARIRRVLGTASYTALYQQRPMPAEGGMFRRDWFEVVQAAPATARRVRYWDKAGTEGDGDYTAGVLMAVDGDGVYYVCDVARGQWSALQRERVIRQTAERDGAAVPVWVEQEPGSGGKESAQATIRALAGFTVRAERVTGDKATRAMPLAAQCEARNVKLVRGAWNGAFLDELTVFPQGKHDDQVDALSGAFAKLARPQPRAGFSYQG